MSDSLYWAGTLDAEAEVFFTQGGGAFWQEDDMAVLWCGCPKGLSAALRVPEGTWVTWSEGRFYLGLPS